MTANSFILIITGKEFFPNVVAIAALVSMPVVFGGAGISYLIFQLQWGYEAGPAAYSAHYVSLCITMLTVIPLALSMVAVVPFQEVEQKLLRNPLGVSKREKFALMFLRVFNHIVYFVIPNIVETMREERQYQRSSTPSRPSPAAFPGLGHLRFLRRKIMGLIHNMIQVGVEGICASIQYIPLWAVEISKLPDRSGSSSHRKRPHAA